MADNLNDCAPAVRTVNNGGCPAIRIVGGGGGAEIFWATVGETPFNDVKAAIEAGRPTFAKNSAGYCFVLNYYNASSYYFSCLAADEGKAYYTFVDSSGWTSGQRNL